MSPEARHRTIAELISHDLRVDEQTPVGRVIRLFEENPEFDAVAVVGGRHPRMVSRPAPRRDQEARSQPSRISLKPFS